MRVTTYLHVRPQKGMAMIGQPAVAHYCFDRPLHTLFNACFRADLVLDGLEEPVFNHPHDGSEPKRLLSWTNHVKSPLHWSLVCAFLLEQGKWQSDTADQHNL